jgi:hypothetical protein
MKDTLREPPDVVCTSLRPGVDPSILALCRVFHFLYPYPNFEKVLHELIPHLFNDAAPIA